MIKFKAFSVLEEGVGAGGLAYEAKVRSTVEKALKAGKLKKSHNLKPDDGGGYDNSVVDMYMTVVLPPKTEVPIEIKMDANAQMGGPSVKINKGKDEYTFSKAGEALEQDVQDMIIDAVKGKEKDIRKYIKRLKQEEPKELHQANADYEVPFKVSKEAWGTLQKEGMLKPINVKVKYNTKFIHDWYAKKKCYYIQIGKSGLFYMKKNPLNLPIPQLSADIEIYIRLTRSGSGGTKAFPDQRSSSIRCIANLKAKGKSDYSLDNLDDAKFILDSMLKSGK
jgi:hypothetical protein